MAMTVAYHFDEDVHVRPPVEEARPAFSGRLHAHGVDEVGDWWAQVTPTSARVLERAPEWVPVWWVFRAALANDDGLVGHPHMRLLP